MQPPFTPIPLSLQSRYRKFRMALALSLMFAGVALASTFLFPTQTMSFDFRNPQSSKNKIFDPRSEKSIPRTNGKVEQAGQLIASTSPLGDFSQLSITLDLEKTSAIPDTLDITLQRSYRAYRFPLGEPVAHFPAAELYQIGTTYYALRAGTLYPFVSPAAFFSRYPNSLAQPRSLDWKNQYTRSNEFIGFRVGSLLSFADGIYVVSSETEIRPIGSAEIFLALGYRFEDVIPVSAEDIGIYRRGRIVLMGTPHPDGTLFQDQKSNTLFIIENGYRRPVMDGDYQTFLLSKMQPIRALESNDSQSTHCTATPTLFSRSLHCSLTLDPLQSSIGPDYEITLSGSMVDIDIATLTLAFETRLDRTNMTTLLAQVKQRLFTRFGLTPR